jgi:hypothetical protein
MTEIQLAIAEAQSIEEAHISIDDAAIEIEGGEPSVTGAGLISVMRRVSAVRL